MAHRLGGGQGRNPFVPLIRASPPGPWSGWRLQEGGVWGKAGSPLLRPSRGRGTADWFGVSKDSDSTQKWQRKSIRHCSQRYGKLKPQVLRELDLPSQDNVSLASTETPPPLYVGPCQLGMQKVCPPLLPPTSPSLCPPAGAGDAAGLNTGDSVELVVWEGGQMGPARYLRFPWGPGAGGGDRVLGPYHRARLGM